ncbi:MAG: AI-2E family transporter [Deltaproteobacteria bacterium]|nr:AI-2E family transporter [Deltaproteobacteria bacterium]
MPASDQREEERAFDRRVTQAAVRLSLLALLVFWCLRILAPFLNPIIGGVVIAIAVKTPYTKLTGALGGRPKLAAVLLVVVALLLLIVPTLALGASLVDSTDGLSTDLIHDQIEIPAPPDFVADWPIVGERLHALWLGASQNLETALVKLAPYMKDLGVWLVSSVGDLGIGLGLFIVAIVIAGAILPNGERAARLTDRAAYLVAGPRGPKLAALAASSVQSVTRGVLGVAAIQSLLAGLGMLLVGVPAAGLWTLLILILAVMQLPSTLVLIPVIVYVFYTSSTVVAVVFAIWSILVGLSDNVLKPLLMGRGSSVPMLVLFMGSLGGFIAGGILGLFVGAVILSLGYTVFMAWVDESELDDGDDPAAATEP